MNTDERRALKLLKNYYHFGEEIDIRKLEQDFRDWLKQHYSALKPEEIANLFIVEMGEKYVTKN